MLDEISKKKLEGILAQDPDNLTSEEVSVLRARTPYLNKEHKRIFKQWFDVKPVEEVKEEKVVEPKPEPKVEEKVLVSASPSPEEVIVEEPKVEEAPVEKEEPVELHETVKEDNSVVESIADDTEDDGVDHSADPDWVG